MSVSLSQLFEAAAPRVFAQLGIIEGRPVVVDMPDGSITVGLALYARIVVSPEVIAALDTPDRKITFASNTLENLVKSIQDAAGGAGR